MMLRAPLAAGLACALLAGTAWGQAQPSTAKANATLVVTYELKGSGVEKPSSNEKHVNWTVTDRYDFKGTMVAQAAGGFPALHKPDAAAQAREADRQTAANTAQQNMQPMMNQAQAIMDKCGDDDDCVMRESMKMAQGVNMNSPQMQSARSNINKATAMPAARYQLFSGGTATGTYVIDEKAYEAYFDAACSFRNEATCAINTTVKGQGPLTGGDGKTTMPVTTMAELDLQKGELIIGLPFAGMAKGTRVVSSKSVDAKSSSKEEPRFLRPQGMDQLRFTASCGACKTAKGSQTFQVEDQLLGRKATLTVSWTFTRP